MNAKQLNILDSELDKPVYRIVDYDRLVQVLKTGKNSFVRTFLWDDPFENLLTNSEFNKKRGYSISSMKYYTYAQCWSFSEENDLLWRTYSPNKESVRLKSTARKLIDSLINSPIVQRIETNPKRLFDNREEDEFWDEEITCFVGKVEYLTKSEMFNFFRTNYKENNIELYLKSLYIKRRPFRNEEELRIGVYHILALDDKILSISDNIFHYEINFNEVFEEIVFDPRISNEKFDGLKEVLKKLKFKNPILKSEIYEKPNISKILNS